MAKNDENLLKNDQNFEIFENNDNLNALENFTERDENETLTIDDLPEDALTIIEEKDNKKVINFAIGDMELSAYRVWGLLLVLLREDGYMTIHTAGGEIRDVALDNFVLKITVRNDSLYDILSQEKNLEVLNFLVKKINEKLSVKVLYKEPFDKKANENLAMLKNLFGDFLQS